MSALPSARNLIQSAVKARGLESLAVMPLRGAVNLAGAGASRLGLRARDAGKLGDELISRYVTSPIEKANLGIGGALGEIPALGWLFKYKLRPGDVIDATKGGVKLTDKQIGNLTRQAHAGDLYTHRLSAPLESKWTYTLALPMMAGAYVQDQLSKPKSAQQLALEKSNADNMNIYRALMGNRVSGQAKTGGTEMNSRNNHSPNSQSLLLQAADQLDRLTELVKQANIDKTAARAENELLRRAIGLVQNGSMDASFVDDFVKEGMSKQGMVMSSPAPQVQNTPSMSADALTGAQNVGHGSGSLTDLYSQTESYIPKHAQGTLSLHEPHASASGSSRGGSNVHSSKGTAHQVMDDFVLS